MIQIRQFSQMCRFALLGAAILLLFGASGCATPPGGWGAGIYGGGGDGSETCHMNADGSQSCGYNCTLGSGGRYVCASSPEGSCQMQASGDVVCSGSAEAAPTQQGALEQQNTNAYQGGSSNAESAREESASCCVNGAYYSCPSAADAAICLGQPMRLMRCMQSCGMGSDCPQECADDYGPKPQDSQCSRDTSRDNSCQR